MDPQHVPPADRVELVATSGDITKEHKIKNKNKNKNSKSSYQKNGIAGYFETAQWTADGTTLLTSLSSHQVRGYIVPADLLSSTKPRPLTLAAQTTIQLSEPTNVLSGAPYFSLADPWTNQLLVSSRDHPVQLFYLTPTATTNTNTDHDDDDDYDDNDSSPSIPSPSPASSYPLTKSRSETFLTATSLIWPAPGTHFVCGARNLLARFDVTRTGSGPVTRVRTIPSERHLSKGGGVGMRGTVSALASSPDSSGGGGGGGLVVAAGTWTRWVGLYDFGSADARVSTWGIRDAAGDAHARVGGDGVTQTAWSPCGRYLLVGERKSEGVLVYDVRVTGALLGWLRGREARGNQRVRFDVFPGAAEDGGFEVWSGTSAGAVKVWEGVGTREGAHEPAWGWAASEDGAAVGSTCVHPSGTVVASCAGSWEFPDEGDDDDDEKSGSSDDRNSEPGEETSSSDEDGDDDDDDDNEGESSGSRMSWMRRRNKASSLKIWSIAGGGLGNDDDARP
ncbi:hypothetical protein F4778DRAFT_793758 [Xylariomycetidae sp. FL2044]|nr:hypothetical protein F4778DRAFT_793758 [Xylariomycetidae sp. FL2044]